MRDGPRTTPTETPRALRGVQLRRERPGTDVCPRLPTPWQAWHAFRALASRRRQCDPPGRSISNRSDGPKRRARRGRRARRPLAPRRAPNVPLTNSHAQKCLVKRLRPRLRPSHAAQRAPAPAGRPREPRPHPGSPSSAPHAAARAAGSASADFVGDYACLRPGYCVPDRHP